LPGRVSGGEQERVAIARAIVNEPPILLADEPSGNLDSKTTREIMELLRTLNEEGMTIVMVTHSAECACYANRFMRISDGLLIDDNQRESGSGLWQGDLQIQPQPEVDWTLTDTVREDLL
jgi:putative ABC transport system ATP-binding protein